MLSIMPQMNRANLQNFNANPRTTLEMAKELTEGIQLPRNLSQTSVRRLSNEIARQMVGNNPSEAMLLKQGLLQYA